LNRLTAALAAGNFRARTSGWSARLQGKASDPMFLEVSSFLWPPDLALQGLSSGDVVHAVRGGTADAGSSVLGT